MRKTKSAGPPLLCLMLLSFSPIPTEALPPAQRVLERDGTSETPEIKHESVQLERLGPPRRFGGSASGVLYTPSGKSPQTVVLFIHPEHDSRNDFRAVPLARKGYGAFGFATRYVKEDHHLIMEEVLLDLAEAIRFLKEERGFSRVILHGHSGGGSTVAYYQNQAQTRPPGRVEHTPAGDPPNLNEYTLSPADGLILSSAHLGRGYAVARKLDPSVVDEGDVLAVDSSLDPFDPRNGYRIPPEASTHSPEFIAAFDQAQQDRMKRLVAQAYEMVRERQMYQALLEAPDFDRRPMDEQLKIQRGAIMQRYMLIYRNFANRFYIDPTIDPNDRALGAGGALITGYRPDLYNYYAHFHPRFTTPEAFLSGNSTASNVFTPTLLPAVTVPLLVILGSADPSARMAESRAHYEAAGGNDKELMVIEGGDHSYRPAGPKAGAGNQREEVVEALFDWLSKRFPR